MDQWVMELTRGGGSPQLNPECCPEPGVGCKSGPMDKEQ